MKVMEMKLKDMVKLIRKISKKYHCYIQGNGDGTVSLVVEERKLTIICPYEEKKSKDLDNI